MGDGYSEQQRQLTGQSEAHLVPCWSGVQVHRDVLQPLQALREAAARAGFDLQVASGFRSFDRQRLIWQRKLSGERPLNSVAGTPLDLRCASAQEQLDGLLRWSALPGTSRHHWGTDLDVFDAAAVPSGYQLQLEPAEYLPGGPFAPLHQWLQARFAAEADRGFFFPYATDGGAVAPEPWHISYRPVAQGLQNAFDRGLFDRLQRDAGWPFPELLAQRADEIFHRYIADVGAV